MTRRLPALALALATYTCGPQHPAVAETEAAHCAPYAELTETLKQRFGETLRFRASDERGFQLEFFANADGSWTLVMRRDGRACAVAAGTAWRERPGDENAF